MGRPSKEETKKRVTLENNKILRRDLFIYTDLENYSSETALEKVFNNDFELRKEFKYYSEKKYKLYFDEIKNTLLHNKEFLNNSKFEYCVYVTF